VLISEARASGHHKEARRIGFEALGKVLIVASVVCLAFILGREIIPSFYTKETSLILVASKLLIVAGFFQFFDCTQCLLVGALRGYKDTLVPTWITLVGYWGVTLPLSYFFGFVLDLKVTGVWMGLGVGLGIVSLSLFTRFRQVSKVE
jgi:MATE family multidrug resistance protein